MDTTGKTMYFHGGFQRENEWRITPLVQPSRGIRPLSTYPYHNGKCIVYTFEHRNLELELARNQTK